MALAAGTRIGSYEVLAQVGARGMGEEREGIRRVSASDGSRTAITTVDASREEADGWPVFLLDGRRIARS